MSNDQQAEMTMRALVPIVATIGLLGSNALALDGDPARGESLYSRCQGCHSIDVDRVGPRHAGLFGRKAGSLDGYNYSDAMRAAGLVWEESTLDRFLTAPRELIPGTKMPFAGIADAQERADLIAWLKQATAAPPSP
jgi:cytochrome c